MDLRELRMMRIATSRNPWYHLVLLKTGRFVFKPLCLVLRS